MIFTKGVVLGHFFVGIEVDLTKIEVLLKSQGPKTLKEISNFLGLIVIIEYLLKISQ